MSPLRFYSLYKAYVKAYGSPPFEVRSDSAYTGVNVFFIFNEPTKPFSDIVWMTESDYDEVVESLSSYKDDEVSLIEWRDAVIQEAKSIGYRPSTMVS